MSSRSCRGSPDRLLKEEETSQPSGRAAAAFALKCEYIGVAVPAAVTSVSLLVVDRPTAPTPLASAFGVRSKRMSWLSC